MPFTKFCDPKDCAHIINPKTLHIADGTDDIMEIQCPLCGSWGQTVIPPSSDFDFDTEGS